MAHFDEAANIRSINFRDEWGGAPKPNMVSVGLRALTARNPVAFILVSSRK